MATITLDYDARNIQAKKTLDFILSIGFFKARHSSKGKNSLERAFEDIENGRITRIIDPNNLYEECLK